MGTETRIRRHSPPVLKIDTIPKPGGLGSEAVRKANMLCLCSVCVGQLLCSLFGS
jgi:hypothetical protein